MSSRYGFDEAKIARFRKEGRGDGSGADYTPWLTVRDVPSRGRSHRIAGVVTGRVHQALLRKSADDRTSPFPGHTYPAATVIGIPSAVKRLRTAARIWTSATWRSKSRDINRWPSSFTQFIFVSTLLRR